MQILPDQFFGVDKFVKNYLVAQTKDKLQAELEQTDNLGLFKTIEMALIRCWRIGMVRRLI